MRYMIIGLSLLNMAIGTVQAEPLNIKPGLWESQTTIEKKRANMPSNLDQLSPEQRAKVEAKLAQQVKRETRTMTSCLSAEKIKSGEAFTGNTHRGACDSKFETQTAQDLVAKVECRGANKMKGTVTMHAPDQEHMSGVVEMTYGPENGFQMLTRSEIQSRWIGHRCEVSGKSGMSGHH